ncbi:MAG: valine--tRNA ligase [Alphaproteobacteria bacterium]
MTIDKTYDPATTEAKHYSRWEQSGAFSCDVKSGKMPYTIMIPPPNVTGSLHMGHALSYTLQDVLIRYHRMLGRDALWQPGTDHAGIATQMVVERKLAAQDISRHDLGRDKFIAKVWEWKAESGGTITRQLRRLGASPDWARERFTMDDGLNKAVIKVFVELHKQGLIYKDKRLVNWDPKMQTAISDVEVESREIKGNLWHFKYPIEDSDEFIIVATTRPETMLGDTAVAVHPENEKLRHLIGKHAVLPLVGRRIPIIGDDYADPEKGTGAVKITPAHDFNDFEVGKRHKLPRINIFDQHAKLNDEAPEKYRGLDRFEARKRIVADIEALGLLDQIVPHMHMVPHGDRSGVPIEPWLSEQWYVDAAILAKPALEAVETGRAQFVPEQWVNTYNAWMRSIEPWCISRQLWWGHQIPAWYDSAGKIYVAETESEAQAQAGTGVSLKRDEDVLDTWFSSALWPFSTLGWPEKTPELARYYPTDVLVTGFDIIPFWVARMMMMGLHFMRDVPFRKIYIHALVRDEKGQKMSKTKGNVIDPLDMIDKYGCDALRFTLAALSTPGRDIRLSPARIEGYRNFATKLWNAARFCQMNGCAFDPQFDANKAAQTINQWIIQRTYETGQKLQGHYAEHRFDLIAQTLYQFVWNDFCDWYVELAKPILQTEGAAGQGETRATAAWALAQMLKFLHPVMPFITEELWESFGGASGQMLMNAAWPDLAPSGESAAAEVTWLIKMISEVRAVRSQLNVPVVAFVTLQVKDAGAISQARFRQHEATIKRLARVEKIEQVSVSPKQSAQMVVEEATVYLPLEDVIDLAQERARLEKERVKLQQEIEKISQKLAREDFVSRAPPEVVEEQRQRLAENTAILFKLEAAYKAVVG